MTPIVGLDPIDLLLVSLLALGPVPVFLWFGFRPLGHRVDRWAAARGVPLTDETRGWVTARLHRARRWRTLGAVGGWLLPYGEMWVTRAGDGTGGVWYVAVVGGYVGGAVAAEVAATRDAAPSGSAVLLPRSLDGYLPRRVRRAAWAVAVASVALPVLHLVLPRRDDAWATPAEVATTAALVIASLAALEGLPRLLLRRPQPFRSPALLRADDALRAWSAAAVAGSGLAVMLVLLGHQWFDVAATTDVRPVRWLALAGVLAWFVASAAFNHLTAYETGWRVTRWRRPETS